MTAPLTHHDALAVERKLHGTPLGAYIRELLTNSLHYPLANLLLEILATPDNGYDLWEADHLVLILASLIQAWFLSSRTVAGRPAPLPGNLIGPVCYSLMEILLEGPRILMLPNHLAYWGFSLAIGAAQWASLATTAPAWRSLFVLIEHWIRTLILGAAYWIFEILTHPPQADWTVFLADPSHVFFLLVVALLGLVIGFAHMISQRYLETLRATSDLLKRYAEWLLGPKLLAEAVSGRDSLGLRRQSRAILFLDIRGFTAWSERHPPEAVVEMLNHYFAVAEASLSGDGVVKIKHTADEIMVVFLEADEAIRTARHLLPGILAHLAPHGLTAGGGLHTGEVVEGLVGSREVKAYDVLGDVVNTAKRLCDNAPGGTILLSQAAIAHCPPDHHDPEPRLIHAKGKTDPLTVYALRREKT